MRENVSPSHCGQALSQVSVLVWYVCFSCPVLCPIFYAQPSAEASPHPIPLENPCVDLAQ